MRHTSAFREIQAMVREAADAAAFHAVHVLADWLVSKGHSELAEQMEAEWITSDRTDDTADNEAEDVPGEGEI